MTAEHEVRALLADRYAAMVDRATSTGDTAGLLRAGDKLLALMASLPIRTPTTPAGGESGGGDGGRSGFLAVVDGEPQVGDAANA